MSQRRFTARYLGQCAACWGSIQPGDLIGYLTDGGRVAHDECLDGATGEEPDPIYAPALACPECWLIHPEGACDR